MMTNLKEDLLDYMTKEGMKRVDVEAGKYINHYTSVIYDGKLSGWTGRNPDKFPESLEEAKAQARRYRERGHNAYAVIIKEIPDER
jgi:hypothetical protein